MNVNKNNKRKRFSAKWTPYIIISCGFLGTVLGSYLVYYFQGEFPYGVLAGGLAGVLILIVIELIKQKTKKDSLPEADERVIRNIFRYFAYISHIFLAILVVSLTIFTLLNKESIPIFYLWIFSFSYLLIAGLGSLIIKRR